MSDLNAMHRAAKLLDPQGQINFDHIAEEYCTNESLAGAFYIQANGDLNVTLGYLEVCVTRLVLQLFTSHKINTSDWARVDG